MGDWSEEIRREERIYPPIHAGRFLELEFLEPLEMTPEELAVEIGLPASEISAIVHEKKGIGPDTASRLAGYFGMSEGFFGRLQARYDRELEEYRREREAR